MKKLLSLFCLTALVAFQVQAKDAKIADINHNDLKKALVEGKVTLIDVNGSDSYKQGHIPGAIDFESQKADLAKLLPKDKAALVVAYCGSSYCSAYKYGAQAALDLGYTNVLHYKEGLAGWKAKNEKLEQPKM
jgi:rhodanese-related sulfurtransferase